MLKLYTKSRDGLYQAEAVFENGEVTVLKGSKINIKKNANFRPSVEVSTKRNDLSLVNSEGILLKDVTFKSLSTGATFVTGRIANGMIVWKTEDGKYVRYTLKGE